MVVKWEPLNCTLGVEWFSVMGILNLNSIILYHRIRKTIGLSTYITKYIS